MNRTTSNMNSFGKKYIFLKLLFFLLGTEVILSDIQCDCESLSFLTELVQQEIFQRKLDYMKLRSELRRVSKEQKVVTPTTAGTTPTIGISGLEKDKPTTAVEQQLLDYLDKQLEAKLQSGFNEFEERANDIVRSNAKLQSDFDELAKRTNETIRTYAQLQSGFDKLEKRTDEIFRTNAKLESGFNEFEERTNEIFRTNAKLQSGFDELEKKTNETFRTDEKLQSGFDELGKRTNDTIRTYAKLQSGFIELEKSINAEHNKFFKQTITNALKKEKTERVNFISRIQSLVEDYKGAFDEFNTNISENFEDFKNTLTTNLEEHVLKIGQELANQKTDSDLFEKKVSNELDKFKSKVNDDIETAGDRTASSITKLLSTLKNSTKNINECFADIETIKDAINDITSDTQRDKKAIKELRNEFDDNVARVNRIFSSNAKKLELTRDCKDILRTTPDAKSGRYIIFQRESNKALPVYCDMETDGGGWTVFQRRFNGETDFNRTYDEYVNGFGTVSGEFWLGLKNIQELAKQGVTKLRLDMTDFSGAEKNEIFNDFKLFDPEYKLYLGLHAANSECTGALGMLYNNRSGFSTYDHEVDTTFYNCGSDNKGGWWYVYKWCSIVELNGVYSTSKPCMFHYGFAGRKCLKSTSMMLRRTT